METTENGCIILKQKEFDELVKKSKENRAKEIKVTYGYYRNFDVTGDFQLSNNLFSQIRRIFDSIDKKYDEKIQFQRTDAAKYHKHNEYEECIKQFENLKWYQRLFFKKEYVKESELLKRC